MAHPLPSKPPAHVAWYSSATPTASHVSGTRRKLAAAVSIGSGDDRDSDREVAASRLSRWGRQALELSPRLNAKLRGRLPRALAALATVAGVVGPLFALSTYGDAASAGACAGLTFLALLLLGWAWLTGSREDAGQRPFHVATHRLRTTVRLLLLDLRELARAPKTLKLFIVNRLAVGVGLIGLGLSSGMSLVQLLRGEAAGSQLGGISLMSGSLLVGSDVLRWALRSQTEPPAASGNELAIAMREFPAIVDLASPPQVETIFIRPTLLHRVMATLSDWPHGEGWRSAEGYAAALQRHLQRRLPRARIERRRWLGKAPEQIVADLVVDDAILIEVQVGCEAGSVQSALDRVRSCRQAWGTRPILLVVFEARFRDVLEGDAAESLLASHESAHLLTACMPALAVKDSVEGS